MSKVSYRAPGRVTHFTPVPASELKPTWLRQVHASGIHGCPAQGCRRCRELMIHERGR